jgi:MoxR-like ATPase
MEEQQVSAEGVTHQLPDPFLVIATQNPLNHTGTSPLPESQLDRFMMRVFMGYPTASEEVDILLGRTGHMLVTDLQSVMLSDEFKSAQEAVQLVRVERRLAQYVQSIAAETRRNEAFVEGVSPRGAQSLLKAAKAWGFMNGRDYVRPEDVRAVAPAVLSHRLVFKPGQKGDAAGYIESMLSSVHV